MCIVHFHIPVKTQQWSLLTAVTFHVPVSDRIHPAESILGGLLSGLSTNHNHRFSSAFLSKCAELSPLQRSWVFVSGVAPSQRERTHVEEREKTNQASHVISSGTVASWCNIVKKIQCSVKVSMNCLGESVCILSSALHATIWIKNTKKFHLHIVRVKCLICNGVRFLAAICIVFLCSLHTSLFAKGCLKNRPKGTIWNNVFFSLEVYPQLGERYVWHCWSQMLLFKKRSLSIWTLHDRFKHSSPQRPIGTIWNKKFLHFWWKVALNSDLTLNESCNHQNLTDVHIWPLGALHVWKSGSDLKTRMSHHALWTRVHRAGPFPRSGMLHMNSHGFVYWRDFVIFWRNIFEEHWRKEWKTKV